MLPGEKGEKKPENLAGQKRKKGSLLRVLRKKGGGHLFGIRRRAGNRDVTAASRNREGLDNYADSHRQPGLPLRKKKSSRPPLGLDLGGKEGAQYPADKERKIAPEGTSTTERVWWNAPSVLREGTVVPGGKEGRHQSTTMSRTGKLNAFHLKKNRDGAAIWRRDRRQMREKRLV